MNQIEQCPHCGKITEGEAVYETKRKIARAGVHWASKQLIINYVALPILGTCIFPIVGTFLGFIIAVIVGIYISKTADNVTDTLDLSMYSSVPFEFKCSHCGNVWERTYEKGVDFTTDAVLKWQKKKLVEEIRDAANTSLGTAIVTGIISIPCAIYCLSHLSGQSNYLLWWLLFIIGIPALIISINSGIKSYNKNEEAGNLECMSISSFRHSNYRAGNPFVGVDRPLDKVDEAKNQIPQIEQPQRIAPISQEPVKRPNTMVYEQTKKKQEITIGRSNSCDIRFSQNDDYASNFHGRIFMNGNQLMYRDTSSNGTVINGKMVHHIAIPINRGDRIMIAGKYPITWSQIDGFLNNSFQQVVPKTNFSSDSRLVGGEIRPSNIVRSENTMTDKAQNLIKLKSLLDAGILTPKEFDEQKRKILNS